MNVMEQCYQVNIIDCNLYILLALSNMARWIFETCNLIKYEQFVIVSCF